MMAEGKNNEVMEDKDTDITVVCTRRRLAFVNINTAVSCITRWALTSIAVYLIEAFSCGKIIKPFVANIAENNDVIASIA